MVVSSSRPSWPRKTLALILRRARTSATSGSIRRSDTPTTWACGRAGFVRGPRKLNAVGTRSSRRTGAACAAPGWKTGANMKAIPASVRHRSTPSAPRSIRTPSASSRSADPQCEEAARLPCLATTAPAPAATMAASVEMLKVSERSPPVPHVSTTGSAHRTGCAISSAVRDSPSISSTVSPLVRRAIRNPPTWAGVAFPSMIASMARAACSVESDCPPVSRMRRLGQKLGSCEATSSCMGAGTLAGHSKAETPGAMQPRARRPDASIHWPIVAGRPAGGAMRAWFNGRT